MAEAQNVIKDPSSYWESSNGLSSVNEGGLFCEVESFIVIDTCFESVNPPLSVTVAVMVCVPTERFDFVNDVPVPIAPLMLELH